MPLQATSGAASYDAFGGGVPVVPNYIEDVFSTYLYTGNGSTQTITNNIDLSTKGGLVWIKSRSGATNHALYDTARGATKDIFSNSTPAETTQTTGLTAFSGTGFSIGELAKLNTNADTYASWTFRKQPKFFDVVTFTKSTANLSVPHNLGSVPGCVIIKATNIADEWPVYHRGLTSSSNFVYLNRTYAQDTAGSSWITPTSTTIELSNRLIPADGNTYVAYLFAHDAGGFGLTGTDNVISCGSFTTDGSGNASVNLGYEPQFWLYKPNLNARYWQIYDTMRGWSQTQIANLAPNRSDAEGGGAATAFYPTATGFDCVGGNLDASTQHIYIAIRRGPMKVPTDATKVFIPTTGTASVNSVVTTGFATDMVITAGTGVYEKGINDRLRGFPTTNTGTSPWLVTPTTAAEANYSGTNTLFNATNTTFQQGYYFSGAGVVQYSFLRAPSFFDEVCDVGTGANKLLSHNLSVPPEFIIRKKRNDSSSWYCYHVTGGATKFIALANNATFSTFAGAWNNTAPTSSTFSIGNETSEINTSGATYVNYLFSTCVGVSKVGSYTGTGTTLQIDCGFTAGARFVLLKRSDSFDSTPWYVWDSARGIVAGNDPYLIIHSTAAEVTNTDYIDTYSAGFEISSTAPAAINASGGTFIFLAIA